MEGPTDVFIDFEGGRGVSADGADAQDDGR